MGNGGVIKMRLHQTNASGKFKMQYEFRNRLAHFNGKSLQKWIVYAILWHLEAGPFERGFTMAHGCGGGGRPAPNAVGPLLTHIAMTSAEAGWGTTPTRVLRTTDGGRTWRTVLSWKPTTPVPEPELQSRRWPRCHLRRPEQPHFVGDDRKQPASHHERRHQVVRLRQESGLWLTGGARLCQQARWVCPQPSRFRKHNMYETTDSGRHWNEVVGGQ